MIGYKVVNKNVDGTYSSGEEKPFRLGDTVFPSFLIQYTINPLILVRGILAT
jgi:hypothetical protein